MYEVYLQCFEHGQPAGIPRAIVRSAFPIVSECDSDHWHVDYSEFNSCDVAVATVDNDPESIHYLCVERPCVDPRLWDGLFELMRLGNVVFWSPDSDPLIASASAGEHMPPDMIEVLGQPQV